MYVHVYYQKYCNFAGPAQNSMSVETAILFKIIICPSVCLSVCLSVPPSGYLLVLTTHDETGSYDFKTIRRLV